MDLKILDDGEEIRRKFIAHFVMSWEEFQVVYKDWLAKLSAKNYPCDTLYTQALLWDIMHTDYSEVSFQDALASLREHKGDVLLMSEDPSRCSYRHLHYEGKEYPGAVVQADAEKLAVLIEHEWFEGYILAMKNCYNPAPILPDDLYVFDHSMEWCIVFTHETTDWDSELDEPLKAAASRYCKIYPASAPAPSEASY